MSYKCYRSIKEAYAVIEAIANNIMKNYNVVLERDLSNVRVTSFSVKRDFDLSADLVIKLHNFVLDSLSKKGLYNVVPNRLTQTGGKLGVKNRKYKYFKDNRGSFYKIPIVYDGFGSFVYAKKCGLSCLVSRVVIYSGLDSFSFGLSMPSIGSVSIKPNLSMVVANLVYREGSIPKIGNPCM